MNDIRESPEDFANAFEVAFARLQATLVEACAREENWASKVGAGIQAGLELAAAEPAVARVLTNEALARGRAGIASHRRLLDYLAELLRPGREEKPEGAQLPEFIDHAMAGGVVMLVAQRLNQDRLAELRPLAPEAIQFVLTPYVGSEQAGQVAAELT